MTYHSILRVIFSHPLIHTLLRKMICFMRTFNYCAYILRNTKRWQPQNSRRLVLQRKIIFILDIFMKFLRGRGDVFIHLRLFLTSYPLLQEAMQFFSDLSFPLSPRKAVIFFAQMNISLRLHILSPFRDGLISLADTL
jgi:hypothetical protein